MSRTFGRRGSEPEGSPASVKIPKPAPKAAPANGVDTAPGEAPASEKPLNGSGVNGSGVNGSGVNGSGASPAPAAAANGKAAAAKAPKAVKAKAGNGAADGELQSPAAKSIADLTNTDAEAKSATVSTALGSGASMESVEKAKQTIQPLLMDRIDIGAASQLPLEDFNQQIGEIVSEILVEHKFQLNLVEQRGLIDMLVHDMLGLGPLEPLLADDSVTDIL
ncbi:MAG: hypothetical protein ACTSUD_13520, partial [Alphaproteobacteria bacterium]